jgi:hypothetical protein
MANSQPKPNDAFVEIHGFLFGDGERLVSLKLHYPIFTPSPPIAARAFNTSSPNQNLRF